MNAANTILHRAAEEAAEAYRSLDGWSDEDLRAWLARDWGLDRVDVGAWRRMFEQAIAERESATRAA